MIDAGVKGASKGSMQLTKGSRELRKQEREEKGRDSGVATGLASKISGKAALCLE